MENKFQIPSSWEILLGIITLILSILAWLYKVIREDLKELRESQKEKVDIKDCKENHDDLNLFCKEKHGELTRTCDRIHSDILLSCEKNHQDLGKKAHVHGSLGQAGEVIK